MGERAAMRWAERLCRVEREFARAALVGPSGADWVALGFLGRVLGFSWAGGFGLLGSFLFFYFFSFPLNSKLFEFKRI